MKLKAFSILMLALFFVAITIGPAKNIEDVTQTRETSNCWFFPGAYATYSIEVEEIWEITRKGTASIRFEIIDVSENEVEYELQVLENALPDGYEPSSFVKTVKKSSTLSETGWFDIITEGSQETVQIDDRSYFTKKVSVQVLDKIWILLGVVEKTIIKMPLEVIAKTNKQSGAWLEKTSGLLLKVEFFGVSSYTMAGTANRTMILKETNIPIVPTATIDIDPDTLNLKSKGKWITAYIELAEGYNVSDIDRATILLNDTIPVDPFWVDRSLESVIGDYDEDGIPDLMVKFDRAEVMEFICNAAGLPHNKFVYVTLTITGQLTNETPFEGNDTIRIVLPYYKNTSYRHTSHKYTLVPI